MNVTAQTISFGSNACRMASLALLAIGLAAASNTPADADVVVPYVSLQCDRHTRTAIITIDAFGENERPPVGYRDISGLPHYDEQKPPLNFCDLGPRRKIAVNVGENRAKGADDNMTLYIGGRVLPDRLWYGQYLRYKVRIRPLPRNNFVEISMCAEKQCSTIRFTSSSFDCGRATRPIENFICSKDLLSEDDAMLEDAFQSAKTRSKIRGMLVVEQRAWLKERENRCQIPPDVWGINVDEQTLQKDADCLDHFYRARIAALNTVSTMP